VQIGAGATSFIADLFKFSKEHRIVHKDKIEVLKRAFQLYGVSQVLLAKINEENKDLVVLASNGVNNTDSFLYGSTALFMMENVKSDILIYVPREA